MYPFRLKKYNLYSPYSIKKQNYISGWKKRIYTNIKKGLINVIVVDGRSQSGKSTTADWVCEGYDANYKLVYTTKEIVEYIKELKELWFAKQFDKIFGKWVFWDEPQLDIPRTDFWEERNKVIQALTTSWGFLKNNLVMALPNIKGLSENVLTNISLRFSMKVFLDREEKIVYRAIVKVPKYNDFKQKWYWVSFQSFAVPERILSADYFERKADNFFNEQLSKWDRKVSDPIAYKKHVAYDSYIDAFRNNVITGEGLKSGLKDLNVNEQDIEMVVRTEMVKMEKRIERLKEGQPDLEEEKQFNKPNWI